MPSIWIGFSYLKYIHMEILETWISSWCRNEASSCWCSGSSIVAPQESKDTANPTVAVPWDVGPREGRAAPIFAAVNKSYFLFLAVMLVEIVWLFCKKHNNHIACNLPVLYFNAFLHYNIVWWSVVHVP